MNIDESFDDEKHEYRKRGALVDSVTDVLRDNGFINPQFYTEEGKLRGKIVHAVTEGLDRGLVLDWSTLHPDLHGYVRSWLKLKALLHPEFLDIEVPRFHPLFPVAGTLDRRVLVQGWECIWDIKTGPAPKWAAFQTAAYDLMLPPYERGRRKRAAIVLHEDGATATVVPHQEYNDGNCFVAFLTSTLTRRTHGIRKDR